MARERNRLTALEVRRVKAPGRYADGGGLYLFIGKQGARAWVFRYRDRVTTKLRDKGLGPVADVTLERARQRAQACRLQLLDASDISGGHNIGPQRFYMSRLAVPERAGDFGLHDVVNAGRAATEMAFRNVEHREPGLFQKRLRLGDNALAMLQRAGRVIGHLEARPSLRCAEIMAVEGDARLEALRLDDASRAAARRLGDRLGRRLLGEPDAPDDGM